MRPEARFTAKSPRSALRHGWWALPLLVGLILLFLRPWDAATPLVFQLKPAPAAASAPASGPRAVGVRIIATPPAKPASVAASR